jgi:stress-induced morphogen
MAINRADTEDGWTRKIHDALDQYWAKHHETSQEPEYYRRNSASIRVRIVDRRFEGMSRDRRHDEVWQFLAEHTDRDTMSQVSLLLLLPPSELESSLMNHEFDHPVRPTG